MIPVPEEVGNQPFVIKGTEKEKQDFPPPKATQVPRPVPN